MSEIRSHVVKTAVGLAITGVVGLVGYGILWFGDGRWHQNDKVVADVLEVTEPLYVKEETLTDIVRQQQALDIRREIRQVTKDLRSVDVRLRHENLAPEMEGRLEGDLEWLTDQKRDLELELSNLEDRD